jgi:hypothetical protein
MALPPVLSGYGPVGASSASVPFFDGKHKREDFADFSYKLRAVLLEHKIDWHLRSNGLPEAVRHRHT